MLCWPRSHRVTSSIGLGGTLYPDSILLVNVQTDAQQAGYESQNHQGPDMVHMPEFSTGHQNLNA